MKHKSIFFLSLILSLLFLTSCVKKEPKKIATPAVTQHADKKAPTAQTKQPAAKKAGTFAQSINTALSLPKGKATQVNQLINKYQKKGQYPKYFGWIRGAGKEKPFQKELVKILNPVQMEQWKHIHASWFDHQTASVMFPYDMKLALGLDEATYFKFVEVFAKTKIAILNLPKNDLYAKNIYAENNKKQVALSQIFDKKTLNKYNILLSNANKK